MRKFLFALALTSLASCGIENDIDTPIQEAPIAYGNPPPLENIWQEDRFLEHIQQPVDILLVVDKSGSMTENLLNLSSNLPTLINTLEDYRVDYRIGVISTDANYYSGKLSWWAGEQWIDQNTIEKQASLSGFINTALGWGEQGVDAIWASISPEKAYPLNKEFFRIGAPLHIIVVSDEEDQSINITPNALVKRLQEVSAIKSAAVTVSSITHVPATFYSCGSEAVSIGHKYMWLAWRTGGISVDICDDDWSLAMEEIALYSVPPVRFEYVLSNNPVDNTIQILVERDGVVLDYSTQAILNDDGTEFGDYTYDPTRNSVSLLGYEPGPTDVVSVSYEIAYK